MSADRRVERTARRPAPLLLRIIPLQLYAGRAARGAGAEPAGLPAGLDDHRVRLLRAGVLPVRAGPGPRLAGRHRRRRRRAGQLRRLHRAGAAGHLRDERRHLRLDRSTSSSRCGTPSSTTRCWRPRSVRWTSRSARSPGRCCAAASTRPASSCVMLVMGLLESWWAVLAVPVALLIALGFGAVGMAITSFLKTFQQLDWITTAILPMFLFSTTFFPLSVYPPAIQAVVRCLPLYQGIELMRGLCLGIVSLGTALARAVFPGDGRDRDRGDGAPAGSAAVAVTPAVTAPGRACGYSTACGILGSGSVLPPVAADPGMVGGGGSLLAPVSETSGANGQLLRNRSARQPTRLPAVRVREPRAGPRATKCTKSLCGRVQYAPGGLRRGTALSDVHPGNGPVGPARQTPSARAVEADRDQQQGTTRRTGRPRA